MFYPATPNTIFERVRLFTGNSMLVFGFIVTLLTASILIVQGIKRKHYFVVLCPIIILFNPFQQIIFFESLDTCLNYQWRDKAVNHNIVGKKPDEIKSIFGNPTRVWTDTPRMIDRDGKTEWQGETYTGWNYHVLPIYWMGSNFQVFFKKGIVSGFEANDD